MFSQNMMVLAKRSVDFEKFGDLYGDKFRAFFEDEISVEIQIVVNAVLDLLPKLVGFSLLGTPAFEVFVEADADDFVRGKKTVGDALSQRVDVNWLAEVFDVRNVFSFLRCRREANLGGR